MPRSHCKANDKCNPDMDANDEGKITSLDALMIVQAAADALDFERAIKLRDAVKKLRVQAAG